jgi:dTDP-4-dehydrorhamnose 3,5-epimerase
MGTISLDDILITPLARIATAGGDVLHAMKNSDAGYAGFGETYCSWVTAGAVKAWKRHTQMTMNIVVPMGQVRFVFRLDGTNELRVEDLGEERYVRITVPAGIWFGFKGLATPQSLVLNIANIAHDPNEVERLELAEIKYDWN